MGTLSAPRSLRKAPARLVARDLRLDAKRRVGLQKAVKHLVGGGEGLRFDAYVDDSGRILLEPKVSIAAREAWLFQNPEALRAVKAGLSQLAEGDLADLGSFAKFADEE